MDEYLLIIEKVEISHECYIYVLKDVMCVHWSTMDQQTGNSKDNALGSSPENPILIHNDELGSSWDNPILIQDDELLSSPDNPIVIDDDKTCSNGFDEGYDLH